MTQPETSRSLSCPKCDITMRVGKRHGIEVDECVNDHGLWLDHEELELLEKAAAGDAASATTYYARRPGTLKCPVCKKQMDTFNYRAGDLPIDFCPDEHGWWLDKGEEKQVMELMRQRANDLARSRSAQVAWKRTVRGGNRGFFDKLKDLFR